jgi:type III secretion protein J
VPTLNASISRDGFTPPRRLVQAILVALLSLALAGCQVEVYRELSEEQANSMLAVLLKRDIQARKLAEGKKGFSIPVEEKELVQALESLKENNLPRGTSTDMGQIFSGQGMISSPAEEQVRLAYAISQELADTFSRIDGVLTARVHVVPAGVAQAGERQTPPSAAVFMRHLPESPVTNLVARVREVTAKAVPNLDPDRVSVMLVPVRESVSVPMVQQERFLGIPYKPGDGPPYVLALALLVAALSVSGGILLTGYELYRRKQRRAERDTAPAE